MLVAELHKPDHEGLAANPRGQRKKALLGHPRPQGYPVLEMLTGTQVKPVRGVFYDPGP